MDFSLKNKRTVLFVVVLAIMPILLGEALHCLIPCTAGSFQSASLAGRAPCPVCNFLAMPRDIVLYVTWDCISEHVERCEPEPVRLFVSVYRSFKTGRAPPVVS